MARCGAACACQPTSGSSAARAAACPSGAAGCPPLAAARPLLSKTPVPPLGFSHPRAYPRPAGPEHGGGGAGRLLLPLLLPAADVAPSCVQISTVVQRPTYLQSGCLGRLCCHSMHFVLLESRYTLCQVHGMLILTTPHKTGGHCLRSHLVSRPDEKARRCSCTDDAARKLRLQPEHAACAGSRWAARPLCTGGRLLHADCPQCILR